MRYTMVFEWAGEGPRVGADTTCLGGRLRSVSFTDEVKRLARLEDAVASHIADLRRSARVVGQHPEFAAVANELRKAADELESAKDSR